MCTHFCEQVRELFPDINSTLLSTSAQLDALHISFQRNPESREPLVSKVSEEVCGQEEQVGHEHNAVAPVRRASLASTDGPDLKKARLEEELCG